MSLTGRIAEAARAERLAVPGTLPTLAADGLDGIGGIVLLGPDEPGFWPHFKHSAEARDGAPDPIDRWSMRVITALAGRFDAVPLFPFGGPPWHPFIAWAKRSGRAHGAPVGLLAHDTAGLFVPYRGALGVAEPLPASARPSPCTPCPAPCRTACPVDAFAGGSYDVAACKAWLRSDAGRDCRAGGCLVRRACPVGAHRRLPEHSAFHMEAFLAS